MRKCYFLWSLFFFLCFLFWTFLYLSGALTTLDQQVRLFFEHLSFPFQYQVASFFSFFASFPILLVITIFFFFFFPKKKAKVYLLLNLSLSTFLVHGMKLLIKRERGIPFFGEVLKDYSYPSGHTMAAICFYSFFLLFLIKGIHQKGLRNVATMICILFILLIPLSRLLLGVHYFSDVVASFLLAFFFMNFLLGMLKSVDALLE